MVGKRVLVVDDEEILRKAMAALFQRKGYTVFQAASGREALAFLADNQVDVVVSDVRMPEGDGIELLREAKLRDPGIPMIIFVTAFTDLTPEDAYGLGACAVLAKPFRKEDLLAAVERSVTGVGTNSPSPDAEPLRGSLGESGLGRGGFCLEITPSGKPPAPGSSLNFEVELPGTGTFHGYGILRWAEHRGESAYRIGVEISSLAPESANLFLEWRNAHRPVAHIPHPQD